MRAQVCLQYMYEVDSWVEPEWAEWDTLWESQGYFDTTPKPHAEFNRSAYIQNLSCTHLGTAAEREAIKQVGLSVAPVFEGESYPQNLPMAVADTNGSDSDGRAWQSRGTQRGWGPSIDLGGGGTDFDAEKGVKVPESYAAELYLNGKGAAKLKLQLQEGDTK